MTKKAPQRGEEEELVSTVPSTTASLLILEPEEQERRVRCRMEDGETTQALRSKQKGRLALFKKSLEY